MTDPDLNKLREIADAATPGEWTAEIRETRRRSPQTRRWLKWKPEHGTHGFVSIVESDGAYGVFDGPDARHVATFDPPTVLALIDKVERLRDALTSSEYMRDVQRKDRTAQALDRLRTENDRLRVEVERLRRVRTDLTDIAVENKLNKGEQRC